MKRSSSPVPSTHKRYIDSLPTIVKARYIDKLKLIDGVDPLDELVKPTFHEVDVSNINVNLGYEDIVEYFIFKESAFTKEKFKAIKSLGGHNQVTSGWVRSVVRLDRPQIQKENCNNECFSAKVYHSQALSGTPLEPWVIVSKDGAVHAAHCTCMAGLAEACSHVAALLFTINTMVKIKNSTTVTQVPAYWKKQPFKEVAYQPASEIDFRSARTQKKALDAALDPNGGVKTTPKATSVPVPQTSENELEDFYSAISYSKSGVKPALLSLVSGYEEDYVVKTNTRMLPPSLHGLTASELKSMSVNKVQIQTAELKTRGQAKTKLWHSLRRGRITASGLHAASHTNLSKPSKTVLDDIVFGKKCATSIAVRWGQKHEMTAFKCYEDKEKKEHEGFSVRQCGFIVNESYPFIGASPDGMRSCACCGQGTLEIKCPYKHKASTILQAATSDTEFCLHLKEGKLELKEKHPYYLQVQCQIFTTGSLFCDVAVWTEVDFVVVRVLPDERVWVDALGKACHLFEHFVVPLIAADANDEDLDAGDCDVPVDTVDADDHRQVLSPVKKKPRTNELKQDTLSPVFCTCRRGESGLMVACDNENCHVAWFHYACVGIKRAPKGHWYCPACRQLPQFASRKVKPKWRL